MDGPIRAPIRIDVSAIPEFRKEELARGALDLMEQVFSMPRAEERCQGQRRDTKSG